MAEMIAVVGESGSGKTTSIRNLNHEETFIITTTGKLPGFRGAKRKYTDFKIDKESKKASGNFFKSAKLDQIIKVLSYIDQKMPHIKNVVFDDYQYIMSFEAMDRAKEKGYEKFTEMAQNAYAVLEKGGNMREDIKFILLTHSENSGDALNPKYKMKTIGKMLDNVITLEGLFTYVFYTEIVRNDEGLSDYKFVTQSDGSNTAKTPMGLFEDRLIDNDLNFIVEKIDEYNEG